MIKFLPLAAATFVNTPVPSFWKRAFSGGFPNDPPSLSKYMSEYPDPVIGPTVIPLPPESTKTDTLFVFVFFFQWKTNHQT